MHEDLFQRYTNAVHDNGFLRAKLEIAEQEKAKSDAELKIANDKISFLQEQLDDARMQLNSETLFKSKTVKTKKQVDEPKPKLLKKAAVKYVPPLDTQSLISHIQTIEKSTECIRIPRLIDTPINGKRAPAWRTVVKDWNHADPSRGLPFPLKDFAEDGIGSDDVQIFRLRKCIGREYNAVGEKAFIAKYNPDGISLHQLVVKIHSSGEANLPVKKRSAASSVINATIDDDKKIKAESDAMQDFGELYDTCSDDLTWSRTRKQN